MAELRLVTTDDRAKLVGRIILTDGAASFEGATAERVFRSVQKHARGETSDAAVFALLAAGWSNGPLTLVADAEKAEAEQSDDDPQQAAWVTAVAATLKSWPALAAPMVDALAAAVAGADAATLAGLTVPQQAIDDAAAALERVMVDVARDAAAVEVATAQAQGVSVDAPEPELSRLAGTAQVTAALIAVAYAAAATRRALQVGVEAATAAVHETLTAMGAAASGVVAEHIGVALSAAQNAGRIAVFETHPPAGFKASEHLDRSGCKPCRTVHGTTYATLADALADYPGNGGYARCAGGLRCRGRVIAVWT